MHRAAPVRSRKRVGSTPARRARVTLVNVTLTAAVVRWLSLHLCAQLTHQTELVGTDLLNAT